MATCPCPCIVESELRCSYIGGFLVSSVYKTRVPGTIQQERAPQQRVEMVVEAPAPMTQDGIVHTPAIIPQDRFHQQQDDAIVKVPVPMTQEEIVRAPNIPWR